MILNTTLLETNIDRDNQSLGQYIPFGKAYVQGAILVSGRVKNMIFLELI